MLSTKKKTKEINVKDFRALIKRPVLYKILKKAFNLIKSLILFFLKANFFFFKGTLSIIISNLIFLLKMIMQRRKIKAEIIKIIPAINLNSSDTSDNMVMIAAALLSVSISETNRLFHEKLKKKIYILFLFNSKLRICISYYQNRAKAQ